MSRRLTAAVAAGGALAVLLAFAGLSLGSTLAKSSDAPGTVVGFWRLGIGACLWHVLIGLRGARGRAPRRVDPRAWRLALLPGVAFGVNISLFFSGVERTPIAHAEFITALSPVLLLPLAAITLHEPIQRHAVLAGLAALAGVAAILSQAPAGRTSYAGDLLVCG